MPSTDGPPRIALAPEGAPGWLADAVVAGGGHVVPVHEAEALVWAAPRDPEALRHTLDRAPQLAWVQLPFAGIEQFVDLVDDDRQWTCGKGVYADPVAEMALTLTLAGMRQFGTYARATEWGRPSGRNLLGANVTILGGGGITESLLRLLTPFDCHITVVRNRVADMDGADEVVEADRYVDAIASADVVILALALTPDTEGMISRSELEQMQPHAWIVNVARGRHIVTDDLVWALENGVIGGAGLDVTDPEPLPAEHRLWRLPNCIITPHVGNTPEMAVPLLSERITANVRRFAAGEPLIGPVHVDLGY
ncbi:MAG TPA: D-isomer specific 2-hydroxyacid dehydrogenase family protein [Ilumatobacteraceae bacterium]|nr:D-isomer specific 2-hydroxyacid dehydrogenase family protein [Ilumatobacteraceae bacterium]